MSDDEEVVTMFAVWMPFRKNGTPVVGTFGAQERKAIVFDMEQWNKLCEQIPQLQTKQFRVGTL